MIQVIMVKKYAIDRDRTQTNAVKVHVILSIVETSSGGE